MTNENCPCKKKKCERHEKCDKRRTHHANSKRQRPVACERKRKSIFPFLDNERGAAQRQRYGKY
ncbi:MAG: hypothetical protein ACI4JF_01145, partial [Oscillospiraceae bacterium]